MPQLDSTWFASQIFWLAVAFVLLYALLRTMALPRLLAVLDQREQAKGDNLSRAEALKQEAVLLREQYEKSMAAAREKSHHLFQDADRAIENLSREAHVRLEKTLTERMLKAEKQLVLKREELSRHLEDAANAMVAGITRKLTGTQPNEADIRSALQSTAGKV